MKQEKTDRLDFENQKDELSHSRRQSRDHRNKSQTDTFSHAQETQDMQQSMEQTGHEPISIMNQQIDGFQENMIIEGQTPSDIEPRPRVDLQKVATETAKVIQKAQTPGGPRSPVSGASKVAGPGGRRPIRPDLVLNVAGQNEDDEYRQNIEKEHLDKILSQELDFEDDDNDLRGGLTGDQVPSPGIIRKAGNVYPSGSGLDVTKLKEKAAIVVPGVKDPLAKPKRPPPGYRKPTIEATRKDVRHQNATPNEFQDPADLKKKNPLYHFDSPLGGREQAAATLMAPSQSNLLKFEASEHLTSNQSLKYSTKLVSRKSVSGAGQGKGSPVQRRANDLYSRASASEQDLGQDQKKFGLRSKMAPSLSGATGGADGHQPEKLTSDYGLLQAIDERVHGSNFVVGHRGITTTTHLKKDLVRQSQEAIYGKPADVNHYELTETAYDEIKQSFDARNTSEINRQAQIKNNFALPPNKAVKVWSRERAFRNRSRERKDLEENKDVTLYVGAVDLRRQPTEEPLAPRPHAKQVTHKQRLAKLGIPGAIIGGSDSSKVIVGPQAAADLLGSLGVTQEGLDESIQSLIGLRQEAIRGRVNEQPIGTGSASSGGSQFVRDSRDSTFARKREFEGAKQTPDQRRFQGRGRLPHPGAVVAGESQRDETDEMEEPNAGVGGYFRTVQVPRTASKEKSQKDFAASLGNKELLTVPPSARNPTATEATQRHDGDTSVAPSALIASKGAIRNVGPGGEVVRLEQEEKARKALKEIDPAEIQRAEKEKEQERIKNEAIYNLLNRKLVKLQDSIKAMTPQSKLHKLDFTGMDARQTIEKHNELQESAIRKFLRNSAKGKYGSASPARLRNFYNTSNTNLKVLYHRNNSGNLQDCYSVTTQVLSGHNTPLTYLRKKKEKLNQINKDQDDLLAQLRERERRVAASALKATKIFHDFVSNLEGHETRSDPASYSKLKEGVERARHSMYIHKMKPLQSSKSFQSWRGSIERQIEGGGAFTESLADVRLPRHLKKHLIESQKRGKSQSLERTPNKKLAAVGPVGEAQGALQRSQNPDVAKDESDSRILSESPDTALALRQQSMLQKSELRMTGKELTQLRCLQLQQQESQMDSRIEQDANKFFSDKQALERDPEAQGRRNALLERVRERLKQKVRDQLQRQLQREARKQERARRSSPGQKAPRGEEFLAQELEDKDPRAEKFISQLELQPPTEQTAEGQASRENFAASLEDPSARSKRTSKAVAMKRRFQARGSQADDILGDSARVLLAEGASAAQERGGVAESQRNRLRSKQRKNSSIESGNENYHQSLNTVSDGRSIAMDPKYPQNNLNLNEESNYDPTSQINLSSAAFIGQHGNELPARPPRASQRNGVLHKTEGLMAQPRLEDILQDDEDVAGQAAQDSLVNPASELLSLQNADERRPALQNEELSPGELPAEEDESEFVGQVPRREDKVLIASNNQTTSGGSERETHGQTFQSSTRQKTAGKNAHTTSGGGMTVTRGSSNRGHTASHQRYTTIQHPQLYFDQTARRIKTRNSVGQSQRFITTQMDARLKTLDFGTKNSSMAEIYSQKGSNQLRLRQNLAKPKTAKDRNRRNRANTLMVGQQPAIPEQMQSINEYVQSQKILNENLHQYQMGQGDLHHQLRTQGNSDQDHSPEHLDSKDEPSLATEQHQPQLNLRIAKSPRPGNQSSLWKENFKKRYEMGLDVYNQLSFEEKQAINKEIKKEFKHCSWAKSNTKTDLDKSGKKGKGGQSSKVSRMYKDSRNASPLQHSKSIRVQSALPDIEKQPSSYQIQRALSISEHKKSKQQDELRKSFQQDPVAAMLAAQTLDMDLAALEQPPQAKKKRNGFKRYSEIDTLSQYGERKISLSRKNFNQIPLNLKPQFEKLCKEWDDYYESQPDFIKLNKELVKNPENTRQSLAAQRLRAFKEFNNNQDQNQTQRTSTALRQCDCHHDLHKPDQEMYKGIINLNKRYLNGINSQTYNSIDAQSNLRLKPWISVERAQKYKQHMNRRNPDLADENMTYDTFLTQLEDGYYEQLQMGEINEELDQLQQDQLKNFQMNHTLDPNRTFTRRDLRKALKLQLPKGTEKNYQTQNLVDFIKDCYDEPKPKFMKLDAHRKISDEDNYKLKNSVSKYVDIEKVHQENMRTLQAKRRVSEVINESEMGDGLVGFDAQQSQLLSVKIQTSAASTTSKRKMLSRSLSHASPKNGESENHVSKIESNATDVDGIADQPLVSLKEVFVEMIRNQTLDYENFLEPSTVEKFNQEKIQSSLKTMTKFKYKRKIWKPTYQQVIPKSIKILCDAKPAL